MKPTSIIFLVLSVIMIAGGVLTCKIAENKAEVAGIDLFAEDGNEDRVVMRDLSESDISRIDLNLKNATVNILPSDADTYIELINFNVNTYGLQISNNILSLDDTVNLLSLLNISEGGFEFKGLRYYKNLDNFKNGEKVVNIFIADSYEINRMSVVLGKGKITIGAISPAIEYTISVNEGDVDISGINNTSTLTLNIKKGSADIRSTVITTINAQLDDGMFVMKVNNPSIYSYSLTSAIGSVFFNNENKGGMYSATSPIDAMIVEVDSVVGDITVSE